MPATKQHGDFSPRPVPRARGTKDIFCYGVCVPTSHVSLIYMCVLYQFISLRIYCDSEVLQNRLHIFFTKISILLA